jgi:hypothetical protein
VRDLLDEIAPAMCRDHRVGNDKDGWRADVTEGCEACAQWWDARGKIENPWPWLPRLMAAVAESVEPVIVATCEHCRDGFDLDDVDDGRLLVVCAACDRSGRPAQVSAKAAT